MQHVNNKYEAALAEGEAAGLPLGELADLRVAAGRWQTNCGSPARGVELLTQAVQDLTELHGADSLEVLDLNGLLGRALAHARRYVEAEELLADVLVERERRLGPDHELTLIARGNLGRCVRMSGRPNEALLMATTLLEDRRRVMGPQHPATLDTMGHVAHALGDLGRPAEAADLFDEQADLRRVVFGPDHWATQQSHRNATTMRSRVAGPDADIAELEQMVLECVRDLGEDHASTLVSRGLLAGALRRAGQDQRAADVLGALVADRARLYGATDPATLGSRRMLIETQLALGQTEAVFECASEFLDDVLQRFPVANVDGIHSVWTVAMAVVAAIETLADEDPESDVDDELLAMFEDLAQLADDAVCKVLEPDHPLRQEVEQTRNAYWEGLAEGREWPEC